MADTNTEARLFKSLRKVRPASIVYARAATNIPLVAIRGAMLNSNDAISELVVESRAEDFLVIAAELKIGDDPIEPTPGDRIAETIAGKLSTYEVIRLSDNVCWRWIGHEHAVLRIHARLVSQT